MALAAARYASAPQGFSPALIARIAERARDTRAVAIAGIFHAGSGHPGGSLSCADILATLYASELNIDAANPLSETRDRFILSKGHAAPALYGIWSAMGLMKQAEAVRLRRLGSRAQGHPHVLDMPLAETSTGSLGQGFSVAIGMALGLRLQKNAARVYALLGDGEIQEGEVWEGAMCAAHHRLSNLCAIIDYNKLQSDDRNANIMGLEPLADKWRAFGWHVQEIDGHDIAAILGALKAASDRADQPSIIIAHTVKGKGVSYMEDVPQWHGSVKLTRAQADEAFAALGLPASALDALLAGAMEVRHG